MSTLRGIEQNSAADENIDAPSARYHWAPYALFALWLAVLWFTGVNKNLLFLIFSFAFFTVLGALWVSVRVRGALLAVGALLPLVQVDNRPPDFIEVSNRRSTLIPADRRLEILFPLYGWEAHEERCGFEELELELKARDYENVDLGLRGARVAGSTASRPIEFPGESAQAHGGRRAAKLRFVLERTGENYQIVLGLQSKNGTDPLEIMKGAESHGKVLYSNAVYLSATGPGCRVLYHSSRTSLRRRLPAREP